MSAFGGDSWAREAECRKKRVNELICEQINEGDYHKLRNGKYACLVCPNRPIVDTLHMLLMHSRGTRHRAAAHRLREKELSKKEEMQKRMALCETSITVGDTNTLNGSLQCSDSFASPLLRQTWKSTADALANRNSTLGNTIVSTGRDNQSFDCTSKYKPFFDSLHARNVNSLVKKREAATHHVQSVLETVTDSKACMQNNVKAVSGTVSQQQLDLQKQREKELKLRASGWQRDGNGGWFRQEDVEFDSDEEDPNVSVGANGSQ